jgi:hypothetical protein
MYATPVYFCKSQWAWIHLADIAAQRCPLIEIRFHTPKKVPGKSMKKSPVMA